MPTLNFNAGKLMLTYYDLRQDHTSGTLTPAPEPTCDPAVTPLCPIGNPFSELRQFEGELLTNPMAVFNPYIDDATLTVRRHTLDIIGSEGAPQSNPGVWMCPASLISAFRVMSTESFLPVRTSSRPNSTLQTFRCSCKARLRSWAITLMWLALRPWCRTIRAARRLEVQYQPHHKPCISCHLDRQP